MKLQHKRNLLKLARTLRATSIPLRMHGYFENHRVAEEFIHGGLDRSELEHEVNECGSKCCAIGISTITPGLYMQDKECAREYSIRIFGLDPLDGDSESHVWDFMFASPWPDDIEQTARRIELFAQTGEIPEEAWDCEFEFEELNYDYEVEDEDIP